MPYSQKYQPSNFLKKKKLFKEYMIVYLENPVAQTDIFPEGSW